MRRATHIVLHSSAALLLGGLLVSPATAQSRTCSDFQYQDDAQAEYDSDPTGNAALDDDHDGVACESLPRRAAGGAAVTPVQPAASAPAAPVGGVATGAGGMAGLGGNGPLAALLAGAAALGAVGLGVRSRRV